MPDRAMTVKEWIWLAEAAEREARSCKRAGALISMATWQEIAAKCRTREDALREGRVVP